MERWQIAVQFLFTFAVQADIIQLDNIAQNDVILTSAAKDDGNLFLATDTERWNENEDFFLRDEDFSQFKEASQINNRRQKRQAGVDAMSLDLYITDLQAHQYCQGIRLNWKRPPFPTSPDGKYVNSEFSHYNVYRSSSYFTNVFGKTPYASGDTEFDLSYMTNVTWIDRDPITNDFMWYAVTMVAKDGRERREVTSVKAMYVGSFGPSGPRVPLTPPVLKGTTMHVAGTYNQGGDQYFVAWDVDTNGDGKPDDVFGVILDRNGRIQFKTILKFTVTTKGHIYQGNPQVVFNPVSNQYLLIFEIASRQYFGGRSFIASRSVSAINGKQLGNTNALLKANENIGARTVPVPVVNGRILYNTATSGYSVSAEAKFSNGRRGSLFQNINSVGKSLRTSLLFPPNLNPRQTQIFFDTKRKQLFMVAQFPSSIVGKNSNIRPKKGFVFVVTKRNATGELLKRAPDYLFVGETSLLDSSFTGYYNEKLDRLQLFWFDIEKGAKVIRSSRSVMDANLKVQESDYLPGLSHVCSTPSTANSLSVAYMPGRNTQVLLWEEIQSGKQKIGGSLLRVDFSQFTGKKQSQPFALYNPKEGKTIILWVEKQSIGQANLFLRHLVPVTHKCPIQCSSGYKCMRDGDCVSSYAALKPCKHRNGGCSHKCLKSLFGPMCKCSSAGTLQRDKKTCQIRRAKKSQLHVIVASLKQLWQIISYSDGSKFYERLPVLGNNFLAVAYDPKEEMIYWGDGSAHTLNRISITGKNREIIARSVVPDGVKLDLQERKLYFADAKGDRIEVMAIDKKTRTILVQEKGYKPRAIEIYTENGKKYIYWTSWSKTGKIERALIVNGKVSERKVLISTSIVWPNGIVIDPKKKMLYWADASLDKIEVTDLMGTNRRVFGTARVPHPYSLALWENRLLVTDWSGTVISINRDNGWDRQVIAATLERPTGLLVLKGKLSQGKTCPDPGETENGVRIGNDFSAEKRVVYKCKKGYMLYGPSALVCLADGTWSSKPPICAETRCRNPEKPPNGNAFMIGNKIDDLAVYTCDPGFKLIGSSRRLCTDKGTWSGNMPRCLAFPVFSVVPHNQTVVFDRYTVLSCQAHGVDVKIEWLKDGKPYVLTGYNTRVLMHKGSIVFLKVRFSDAGVFTCRISNPAGTKEAMAVLKVLGNRIEGCGERKFETRQKIFGGTPAVSGAYPWMALIWNRIQKRLICGGSLIGTDWVVTAAHCISDLVHQSHMQIKLGKIKTNKVEDYQQVFEITHIYKHPQYDSNTFDSDIAILKLSKKAIFTDYVKPICLPLEDDDFKLSESGHRATVIGWGSKTHKQLIRGKFSRKLMELDIPIISQEKCKKKMPRITTNMICAGSEGKDSCKGDSGGPLTVKNRSTGKHVLVGIVSWGERCGTEAYFGVYTRVAKFINWIDTFTQKQKGK